MASGLSPQRPDDILAYDIRVYRNGGNAFVKYEDAIYSDFYLEKIQNEQPWITQGTVISNAGWWTLDLNSPIFLKNYDVDVYIGITTFFGVFVDDWRRSDFLWGPQMNLLCYEVEQRVSQKNSLNTVYPGNITNNYIVATAPCYREKTLSKTPNGTQLWQYQYDQGNVNTKFYKLQMNRPEPLTKLHFLLNYGAVDTPNDDGVLVAQDNVKTLAIGIEFSLSCKNKTSQRPGHKRANQRLINSCS